MLTALALTLATLSTVKPSCSWDHPGVNPYTGGTTAALDRYTDIPLDERIALQHRIERHEADDTVSIKRDSISGKQDYDPVIRDMHFGAASVCSTVTRAKWADSRDEAGAVYCAKDHCILVPRICGNVSRITRRAIPNAALLAPPAAPLFMPRRLSDRLTNTDLGLVDADDPAVTDEDMMRQLERRIARTLASLNSTVPEDDIAGVLPTLFDGPPTAVLTVATPVPEADTWAMLLGGLGLLALVRRRARAPR
ncbi:MHFG family PEP-CTERM protein [Rugamonas sp.]|uniref:MHFG family PEP-CTERM protein n=1 Tax=Rugamonas sp. TaxID=1926287 RepID=UPI0025D9382B|nr:MHFG family PEP-CTERM protein [Rugamonas sp.]